jgi:hypothetical protein
LREPGTHNPRPLRITQICGYGFRARGQEPAPRNDDLDRSQLMKVGITGSGPPVGINTDLRTRPLRGINRKFTLSLTRWRASLMLHALPRPKPNKNWFCRLSWNWRRQTAPVETSAGALRCVGHGFPPAIPERSVTVIWRHTARANFVLLA